MWMTKQRATQGPVFGSTDRFEGLGIFIDTYKNNRPGVVFPLVMAMMGDGQTSYDNANDGKANELASCSVSPLVHAVNDARLTCPGPWHPWGFPPYQASAHLLPRRLSEA